MALPKRKPIERRTHSKVTEGDLTKGVAWEFFKEKTFHEKWLTEQYGKIKAMKGLQIGGQPASAGPDVLAHIKQHDAKNTSGSIKDGLDIMEKLQKATDTSSLLSSILPLQSILGGGLYKKAQSAGAACKAQQKKQKQKQAKVANTVPIIETVLDRLLNAAMALLSADDAVLVAELLDDAELDRIDNAFYSGQPYTSTIMPQTFIDAINSLMPTMRLTTGA